jgi:hypothetical protein
MENSTHIKIVYALLLVVLLSQVVVLYEDKKLQAGGSAHSDAPLASSNSNIAIPTDISVGPSATVGINVVGTITQIGSNSFQVKDQTGAINLVSVDANTKLQLAGKLADAATQQKNMTAYNAQVTQLLQDPVKNKAALASMQFPQAQQISPIPFSALQVGDSVLVVAGSVDSNGTYSANTVTKYSSTQTQ